MNRLFSGRSGVVAGLLVTAIVATLLIVGVGYLAVGSASDLRAATAKAVQLKAKVTEIQDSTRIGDVFSKGWFAQPATRKSVTDDAQVLVQGVRSPNVPLADPLVSLARCQAALDQLQSEQTTIAAPAFSDASLAASQKEVAALYDPPIEEVRNTMELVVKWRGLTPKQRGAAAGSLQTVVRTCLDQSASAETLQHQVSAASVRSKADEAELNRQIDEGFAQVRTKAVWSVVFVVLAVVLAAVSIAFALWPRSPQQTTGRESGPERQD